MTSFAKKPTIVIPAYNRPAALQRLLASLLRADYPADVRLVIAIDGGGEWETGDRKSVV